MRIVMVILKERYKEMLRTNLEKDFGGDFDGDGFTFLVWKRQVKGHFEADVDGDLDADGDGFCLFVSSREIVKS